MAHFFNVWVARLKICLENRGFRISLGDGKMWGCFASKTPPHTPPTLQSPKEPKNIMDHMKIKIWLLLVVIVLTTSGCVKNRPEVLPTSNMDEITSTEKAISSPTLTILPTHTVEPTKTKTPKPSSTLTNTPTETPTLWPTMPPWDQIKRSDDGRFIAKLYWFYETTERQTIEISNNEGDILWLIPYQGELPTGDPQPSLTIYDWSKDSKYLYFYYRFSYDGALTLWNGFNLQKIDVETGKISQVIPSSKLVSFSISPSGKQIAFIRMEDDPRQLVIKDFSTGEIKRTSIHLETEEFVQGGWIEWAQNEKKLVFHIADGEWLRVYVLDIDTMQKELVNESWIEEMWFEGWTEEGHLRFITYPELEVFEIDLDSKEKTIIGTITPTPNP